MLTLVGVVCGYLATSYFFLRNPQFLHQKKKRFRRCLLISHRGGAGEGYENTIDAFKKGISNAGTDMIELDCQLTLDKVVVVSHDNNLMRSTGCDKFISNCNFKDLPNLKEKLPIDFDPGSHFIDPSVPANVRKITTLEEVFRELPEVEINIDIKDHNEDLINGVDKLVRDFKREDRTVWGNAKYKTTELCYKTNPNTGLMFSFHRVILILVLYYLGLLPFYSIKETHFEVPMPYIMKKMDLNDVGNFRRSVIVNILDKILMRPTLFEHLTERGIFVYCWVLNNEEEFEKALSCGASGIMTDYPTKLRAFLNENPQFSSN